MDLDDMHLEGKWNRILWTIKRQLFQKPNKPLLAKEMKVLK